MKLTKRKTMSSFNERKKSNQIKEFRLRWFGQGKQKQPLYNFFKGYKLKELGNGQDQEKP